ncbi:MAG TPA: transposase [Candidatus Hydrogenedentes bacterium]|nr:transposase [Candidatus Hydrogenedentota bacterium]
MARQARLVVPGVGHHVTQRGNNRQDVFFVDEDRRVYLSYLRESAERYGLAVSAFCLMTNHIHLVATPEREESLSKALGRAHLMYAQYVHRLHGRLGHFWQSRFYSCPLDEAHAHNAAAYIELNPVRAGMVAHASEYLWSSAGAHCGESGDPSGMLALSEWFKQMPVTEWKATLNAIAESDRVIEGLRIHTRTGRPLGDDAFLSKVETLLGCRIRTIPVGRPKGSRDKKKRKPRGVCARPEVGH